MAATRLQSWLDGLADDARRIRDTIGRVVGKSKQELDSGDELLHRIIAQLASSGAIPSAPGDRTGAGQLPLVLTVNLPISPSTLTEMLLAGDKTQALGTPGLFKFSATVAAGGTTTVVIPNPQNAIILFVSPLDVTSSYYSTGIILDATVDGVAITGAPGSTFNYQLTGSDSIVSVLYSYVTSNVVLEIVNNTGTPATVTFKLENFTMDRDTWLQYWIPMVRGSVAATKRIAGLVG